MPIEMIVVTIVRINRTSIINRTSLNVSIAFTEEASSKISPQVDARESINLHKFTSISDGRKMDITAMIPTTPTLVLIRLE